MLICARESARVSSDLPLFSEDLQHFLPRDEGNGSVHLIYGALAGEARFYDVLGHLGQGHISS
jgi:hypothetical protein